MPSATAVAFERAQPFIVGIGVPIAIVLLGLVAPIVYAQGQSIQKLTDQIEGIRGDVSKFVATADRLDKHMTGAETDPARVLAQTLGTSVFNKRLGSSIVIGGEIYVFPKDMAAQTSLIAAGYREKEVSPTISGFVASVPTVDSQPLQRPGR